MRTAEEIVNEGFKDWVIAGQIKKHCQLLINEARKEAIEECANNAAVEEYGDFAGEIDKQSILSLVKELK